MSKKLCSTRRQASASSADKLDRVEKAGGRVGGGGDELVRAAVGGRIKPGGELPWVEVVAEVAGGGGWVRAAVAELPAADELLLPLRRWRPGRFGDGARTQRRERSVGGAGSGERGGGRWRWKTRRLWGRTTAAAETLARVREEDGARGGKWELGVGVSLGAPLGGSFFVVLPKS
jgi:hypothetical protein